ncbi:peptidoglycan DD-metalloendopeptidase family protein [Flavobacterium sp. HXWNR69]|uniref:Peptidoglycan DD-metalloendopeptidase family protein n=1 Tax=Flavobacterium fragile TaxID=2949085 RepID=A0ABT0TEV2_9FLAO|nr:peptidoglycan DD-metalloendopeptidase family protein [Flavobacterium sp. HXWNR69]MCL9769353.1 peptidoglycan DD-metalloendopeptidase family protein [Flavobacterium sp. HXWNR69]
MRYLVLAILFVTFFTACNSKEESDKAKKTSVKKEPIVKEYGFTFNDFKVVRDTIRSGDTFSKLLEKFPLKDSLRIHDVTEKVKDSFNLRRIKAGKPYILFLDKKKPNTLKALVYIEDRISYTVVDFRDSIAVFNKKKPTTVKRRVVAAEIEGSLSETLTNAGVSAALGNKLASIYAYTVDFFKIQKGDKFAVTINERYIEDSIYVGVESIEASYFEHKGKKIFAFPYKISEEQKKSDYYDENGKGLKSMFLKAPLDYFRISSRFSGRRFHPVQMRFKAHNGTDYAAPHGTPIKTTASGIVERTGYTSGNGNYVKVRHSSTYATQYLHMSKILVRNGQRVTQGQVIGKVGSTGLATGPHVCYRFWKNGVQVDPLRQKLPNAEPLNASQKKKYLAHITPLKKELDSITAIKFKE